MRQFLDGLLSQRLPRIERATILQLRLPLKSPFETSFGAIDHRDIVLCALNAEGLEGWGESAADADPMYSYETAFTTREILQRYLIPSLKSVNCIADFHSANAWIRGYPMAKATVEAALWDLLARKNGEPLHRLWGGTKSKIPCGVSVGLQNTNEHLLETIRNYLAEGYRRIKIKIKPGKDIQLLEAIRREFPDVPLMADANAAYKLSDAEMLSGLDAFQLMMIEQPLHFEDLYEHSLLQRQIQTPVCLDESVVSAQAAHSALEMGSCRIINIKTGRVGGHAESIRIHDLASDAQIPVWCGGMLESGIGRAHNLALAALPNFSLPGDTSASRRYWHRDIIDPPVEIDSQGYVTLPDSPGMGYQIDYSYLQSLVSERQEFPL